MPEINQLPQFSTIKINEIRTEVEHRLQQNRSKLAALLEKTPVTWNNLMEPLDELHDNLHSYWSLVSHMNAVVNSPELRTAYNECLPLLSEYYTELSHNEPLYQAINRIKSSSATQGLDKAQRKVVDNELRDFKLSGVTLSPEKKAQFAKLVNDLTQLSSQYEENVLDDTMSWQKLIEVESSLAGIPKSALTQAAERAQANNQQGWLFTLEMPSYHAIITYADSRSLREEIYRAYVTRASDLSPNCSKWDNSDVMQQILCKRFELSHLLGFESYAAHSLATKMVKTPQQVLDFLNSLAAASYTKAQQEFQELSQFARTKLNIQQLEPWDISYASEKMRHHDFDISEEALRPYFAAHNVVDGLFSIVKKLFQIDIRSVDTVDTWHPDVRCYALYDCNNTLRSYCYFDLYARANKRGGAWMDDCRIRRKLKNNDIQLPIAFVTCNFNGPTKNEPALFSHDEVVTLFHEFGHALQHMLTTVDYAAVSGIHGVPWDAVELASQFLENWAWQKEALDLFAKHYVTGEMLPDELFAKLNRAKNFHSAMQMVRQIEFSLFDFLLHIEFDPQQIGQIQEILNKVREKVSVVPIAEFNRFQHAFAHIFAGGYAAGYYSYKWAEVMASDAFSLFLEKGIFDTDTAASFLHNILEPGGSEDPDVLFKKYRGRDPNIESLLRQEGIL